MVLLPPCTPDLCGKDFRNSLKKPSPNYPYGKKTVRIVPAFTIQAMQKNTKVLPPPKCGVLDPLPPRPTMFRRCYQRGEFPVSIEFTNSGKRLQWKVYLNALYDWFIEVFYLRNTCAWPIIFFLLIFIKIGVQLMLIL